MPCCDPSDINRGYHYKFLTHNANEKMRHNKRPNTCYVFEPDPPSLKKDSSEQVESSHPSIYLHSKPSQENREDKRIEDDEEEKQI